MAADLLHRTDEDDAIVEKAPKRPRIAQRANRRFECRVHCVSNGRPSGPLLEEQEEASLVKAWQRRRDRKALETLVVSHDRMLRRMAQNTAANTGRSDVAEDIYAEGLATFVDAIDRFQPGGDARLAGFAKYAVAGAMLRLCLDTQLPMRIGTSSDERKALFKLPAAERAFEAAHGRSPALVRGDIEWLAAEIDLPRGAVGRALGARLAKVVAIETLEEGVRDDAASASFSDTLVASGDAQDRLIETAQLRRILIEEIVAMRRRTSARAMEILVAAVEGSASSRELASRYGVSIERVGQIRRGVLTDLGLRLKARGITRHDLLA